MDTDIILNGKASPYLNGVDIVIPTDISIRVAISNYHVFSALLRCPWILLDVNLSIHLYNIHKPFTVHSLHWKNLDPIHSSPHMTIYSILPLNIHSYRTHTLILHQIKRCTPYIHYNILTLPPHLLTHTSHSPFQLLTEAQRKK